MFVGHWAPAIAVAAATPKAPKLGVLFFAAQLTDLAMFVLVIAGVEKFRITPGITAMNPFDLYHMPYTHSLAGTVGFGVALALVIYALTRHWIAAALGGLVVLSHWFTDLLVHRPDLTLAGSEPKFGLGLWNLPAIAIPLEIVITLGALMWYERRTRGPKLPLIILVAVLVIVQVIHWFGPVPARSPSDLAFFGFLTLTLICLLAWWVGTTRRPRHGGLATYS